MGNFATSKIRTYNNEDKKFEIFELSNSFINTGKKDVNGNDIFVGDYVKISYTIEDFEDGLVDEETVARINEAFEDRVFEVEINDGAIELVEIYDDNAPRQPLYELNDHNVEVIGNIIQTPKTSDYISEL